MLLKISYPCIGGLFVLSAQIGAVHKPRQTGVFIFISRSLTQRSGVFKFSQGYSFALYNHRDSYIPVVIDLLP